MLLDYLSEIIIYTMALYSQTTESDSQSDEGYELSLLAEESVLFSGNRNQSHVVRQRQAMHAKILSNDIVVRRENSRSDKMLFSSFCIAFYSLYALFLHI